MDTKTLISRAKYYRLDDISHAVAPGGKMANILMQLEETGTLSNTLQLMLKREGYFALQRLAAGEISYEAFLPLAQEEQLARNSTKILAEQSKIAAAERERMSLRLAQMWRELQEKRNLESARRNSPARIRESEILKKYGLPDFSDSDNYPKLMALVLSIDKRERILIDDYIWLKTTRDKDYGCFLTLALDSLYHEIEALFYANEFKRTKDPWKAVSASKHFRKCKQANQADALLSHIEFTRVKDAKLRSALFTTYGGVKRNLGEFDKGVKLGEQAHTLTPCDYRPCTLLGALHYERGEYELGQKWYDKAVERGFDKDDVDRELKTIFWHMEPQKRNKMREHLLALDPVRYTWARAENKPAHRRASHGGANASSTPK